MLGNRLSWIISAFLAFALIIFVLMYLVFPTTSKPTHATTQQGALELIAPANDMILDILGKIPTGQGNAANDYAKAIEYFHENQADVQAANEFIDDEKNATLPAYQLAMCKQIFKLMAQAGQKKNMQFTFVHTPKKLQVSLFAEGQADLYGLSNALGALCVHQYRDGKINEAIQAGQVKFILGWHMMNERARAAIVDAGMDIQLQACENLRICYEKIGEKSKAEACRRYITALEQASQKFSDKFRIVWANKPQPGDIFNIIDNDNDRTWRIEGVLALGVLKFTAKGSRGDRQAIEKHIQAADESEDEMIRAAAKIARECTKLQVQSWSVGN